MEILRSPQTNKEIPLPETLIKIQSILKENNYKESETFTDQIQLASKTFDLLMEGMLSMFNRDGLDTELDKDAIYALQVNWYRLKSLIHQREEEHNKIWYMALHGDLMENI